MPSRLRWFELALVLGIAFGAPLIASMAIAASGPATGQEGLANANVISLLAHEALALALLGYVLARQGRTRADIGLTFSWKDIPRSLVLVVASHAAYLLVYALVTKLFPEAPENAQDVAKLTQMQGARTSLLVGVALLNPFFEESIVRAYAMTELTALTGSRVVAVVGSLAVQVAYHLYQGPRNVVALGALFLIFSLYYAWSGRAAPVILAHMYLDAIVIAFYLRG